MGYVYKAVPFIGKLKGEDSMQNVSTQLAKVINDNAIEGWEFYQIGELNIEVSPGCLSSLFGAKKFYMKFDQLIFRIPV